MIAVVEANAFRQIFQLQSPRRGTPSRVLSARLRRCLAQRSLSIMASAKTESQKQSVPNTSNMTKRSQSTTVAQTRGDYGGVEAKILGNLLRAVQSQNSMAIFSEMKILGRHEQPDEVIRAFSILPTAAFSEFVRSLDPFRVGPRADLSHGLRVSSGLRHFSPVSSMVNQFGIRKLYHNTLHLMRLILDLRFQQGRELMLSDYIVLLRCAGAASDIETAKWIWRVAMRADTEKNPTVRGGLAYAEFMKARFLTEPLYMQNDLARFRLRPRDLHGHRKRFADKSLLRRLERLRLSIFANNKTHFGRAPDQPTHSLHRKVSLHRPVRRVWAALRRQQIRIDHELISAYLIACGRVGSTRELIRRLWQTWGVRMTKIKDHRATEVVGGVGPERLDRIIIPNLRVLNAIVHAFSSTGNVILARKLMIFFSERYRITIPPGTWSLLLNWTYVLSSKPASTEWKIIRDANRFITAEEVLTVWDMMTSGVGPHSPPIKPTFKDTDVYIKSLIMANKLEQAWEEIRRGCASYADICEDVESSLFERLYPLPPPEAISRHLQAKVKQHTTWFTIEMWCKMWLEKGAKLHRDEDLFSQRIIPDFVAEFKDFLPNPATYKTSGGTVRITMPQNLAKQSWKRRIVRSPHTSIRARDLDNPKYTTLEADGMDEGAEQWGEAPDGLLVPVVTPDGRHLYGKKGIKISRWTKTMLTKRRDQALGQKESRLASLYAEADADEEQVASAINEEARRIQKSGYKHRLVLSSLFW